MLPLGGKLLNEFCFGRIIDDADWGTLYKTKFCISSPGQVEKQVVERVQLDLWQLQLQTWLGSPCHWLQG